MTIAELSAAAFGKAKVCGGNCVTNNTRWRKSTWPHSGMVFIIFTKNRLTDSYKYSFPLGVAMQQLCTGESIVPYVTVSRTLWEVGH